MGSGSSGRGASLIDVLRPPENPWLKAISDARIVLPQGVRIRRNSSDQGEGMANAFERHVARLSANARLRNVIDME